MPSNEIPISEPLPHALKHHAQLCVSLQHRFIPESALRDWVSGRASIFGAILAATLILRILEARVSKILVGLASTQVWTKLHNVGSTASVAVRHGRPTYGDGFARGRLRQKLIVKRWKPTTNLRGNRSRLQWHARTSPPSRRRNRRLTRRRHWISTRNIQSLRTFKNSMDSRATLTCRRSHRALPVHRMR